MNWHNNPNILFALDRAASFVKAERGASPEALRTRALRQLVELNSEPDLTRRRCLSAALGLLVAGLEPNADDLAWLVRDGDIGFPQQPSFDF